MARKASAPQSQTENENQAAEPNRPLFTWQLPTGNSKRPRSPEGAETSVSRRRRASYSLSKHYLDESSDEVDSGDEYKAGRQRSKRRPRGRRSGANSRTVSSSAIAAPASMSGEPFHFPTRASVPTSPSIAATSALPSWLPEFTPADKAAALRWVITRQKPADFLHNLTSWLDFADMVSDATYRVIYWDLVDILLVSTGRIYSIRSIHHQNGFVIIFTIIPRSMPWKPVLEVRLFDAYRNHFLYLLRNCLSLLCCSI